MKCAKVECLSKHAKPARWLPVLLIWAKGDRNRDHDNASTAELQVRFCEDCRDRLVAEDLLTDEGWEIIRAAVLESRKYEPDRETVKVGFRDGWRRM